MAPDKGYTTVYLVTSGDYSDYTVWCAFAYRSDAEAYIKTFMENKKGSRSWGDPGIEETTMWYATPIVKKGRALFSGDDPDPITLDLNGNEVEEND